MSLSPGSYDTSTAFAFEHHSRLAVDGQRELQPLSKFAALQRVDDDDDELLLLPAAVLFTWSVSHFCQCAVECLQNTPTPLPLWGEPTSQPRGIVMYEAHVCRHMHTHTHTHIHTETHTHTLCCFAV